MEIEKERFKKLFPNLAQALEGEGVKINLRAANSDQEKEEKTPLRKFAGYSPNVVDFIRRCTTEQQAEKIIEYLEKRGEIRREDAEKLMQQIKKKGVRSFGSKKEEDYYLKHGGL